MNIALGKSVTSNSVAHGGTPEKAVDGKSNEGKYKAEFCAHTKKEPSFLSVDMDGEHRIKDITLVGRADECSQGQDCREQTQGWTIRVGNAGKDTDPICKENVDAFGGKLVTIQCETDLSGRYVTVFHNTWMVLCEIQVFVEKPGLCLLQFFFFYIFQNFRHLVGDVAIT